MHRSKLRGNTISQTGPSPGGVSSLPHLLGFGSSVKSNDPSSCTVFVSNVSPSMLLSISCNIEQTIYT